MDCFYNYVLLFFFVIIFWNSKNYLNFNLSIFSGRKFNLIGYFKGQKYENSSTSRVLPLIGRE